MKAYTYLLVNFFTILVPFLFSFHPKLKFHQRFRSFLPACLSAGTVFVIWDTIFTAKGVWGFNPEYVSGIYAGNLPLEEILFFVCIPFACLFTYHCINRFFNISWSPAATTGFTTTLGVVLTVSGFLYLERSYTSVTFISLGLLLLILAFTGHTRGLVRLFTIYPLLLLPFFIVNGILTGTGPDEPVVWYNNLENLGIRMLTIPFEDIFYGFELLLLNVLFYEYFELKFPALQTS